MIFPNMAKIKSYSEGLRNIYEYIDIKNIIKKLQGVDKLKLILLDKNQRIAFEMLPKPGVGNKRGHHNSSVLTMESIFKSRDSIFFKEKQLPSTLLDGNSINNRIYRLLDPEIKRQMEHGKKTKKIFFKPK